MSSAKTEFLAGVRATMPILPGVFPFGLIFGTLAIQAGMQRLIAQSMSALVFAGSSQFIAAQLIATTVPAGIIVITGAIVNLRHMLYSASVAPYLLRYGWRWKIILAYLLTDEAYAIVIGRLRQSLDDAYRLQARWYFLGAGLAMWCTWQISTALGLFIGGTIPTSWQLDFALPLTFIALVFPTLKDRSSVAAALVAGTVALPAVALPLKLGLLVAAACGIAAGVLTERSRPTVKR